MPSPFPHLPNLGHRRFSVANAAELQLRRIESSMSWASGAVTAAMYLPFLGTVTPLAQTPKVVMKMIV